MEFEKVKFKVYKAALSNEALKEFEVWLYSGALNYSIDSDFICDLFEFRFKEKDALYNFRKLCIRYAGEEEFNFFTVKNLLIELVQEYWKVDNILATLYELTTGYPGRLSEFIQFEYCIWDPDCFGTLQLREWEVKAAAEELLDLMRRFEAKGKFSLDEFDKAY